jgi:carboxyl-terminal processing protease
MERSSKVVIIVLLIVTGALASFTAGLTVGRGTSGDLPLLGSSDASDLDAIEEAYDTILEESVNPPDADELSRGAIRGMLEVLKENDDYALFYDREGFRSFQELSAGSFSGIGVYLDQSEEELQVLSVLPGTPAEKEGVKPGDVLYSIDGDLVSEMTPDEAVARVKGPEGTEVSLVFERGDERVDFEITREEIALPNLVGRVIDDDIGYIQLFGFGNGAGDELRSKVEDYLERDVSGLVLDLRDNGGGLFDEALDVASVFIEEGEIVTYRDKTTGAKVYEAEGDAFQGIPLVVLVNERTASASEIVAAALQDRDRAQLVGETTFGKGAVQEVLQLSDSSAIKLTTATYESPDGHVIEGEGIRPDVTVPSADTRSGYRAQKERALTLLKGLVSSSSIGG